MYLFINTLEKNCPSFAVLGDKGEIFYIEKFIDRQEKLVEALVKFFKKNKIKTDKLKAVLTISGPGSFSGSRAGVILANAFNFLYQLPILGIKADNASLEELIKNNLVKLKKAKKTSMAKVYYKKSPNIN